MNKVLDKIRTRGYWQVIIRPTVFVEKRIRDISLLEPILRKTFVQFRGWDFPHLDRQVQIERYEDAIGQELEWDLTLEYWRFVQSGQFIHLSGLPIDWRDQSSLWPATKDRDWKSGVLLDVVDTVFRLTEIFEFSARLALTEAGHEQMHIEIGIYNLKNRRIWLNPHLGRMPFSLEYRTSMDKFIDPLDLKRTELAANPRQYALKYALELFKRFGWNASQEVLSGIQSDLRDGVH